MRAKRKRATRKPPVRKPPAPQQNEDACSNLVAHKNEKPATVPVAPKEVEVDQCNLIYSSSSPSSQSDDDESFKVVENSSDDSSTDRRSKKSARSLGRSSLKSNLREIQNPVASASLLTSGRNKDHLNELHEESHYNSNDLKAASLVIDKVMRMEEAQPFCVPVDPVALGRPEYFDIVHTPMDFSTISRNLRSRRKYRNAIDVYNDVECIWGNCLKLYRKGEHILYLMKHVKKKFMKYWAAAGLDSGQLRESQADIMPGYAMRHNSRFQPLYPSGHAVEYAAQSPASTYGGPSQWQNSLPCSSRLQFSKFPYGNSVPYQLQHLSPATDELHFLHSQTGPDCNSEGFSLHQARVKSVRKHNQVPGFLPVDLMTEEPSSEIQPYKTHLSHKHPYGQELPRQQPSQLHTAANTDCTGFSGHLPRDSVDPMVVEASQLHLQPSLGNHNRLKEPLLQRASCTQPSSGMQNIENSQVSLTESAARGINCALRYSHRHSADKPSQGNQSVLHPCETLHDQVRQSDRQPSQSQQLPEQGSQRRTARKRKEVRSSTGYPLSDVEDGADKPSQGNQSEFHPCETLHEQATQSEYQPSQSQQLPEQGSQRHTAMKRKQVRSLIYPLSDIEDEERISVRLNDFGQPVGPEAIKLSNFLGRIARNGQLAPLNYVQWKSVPTTFKEKLWHLVQKKFDIDSSCKIWVVQAIGARWRCWKRTLKRTCFDPHKTNEERLKNRDLRVLPEQWSYLVSYWNSDKAKEFSMKNRANGKMRTKTHATGRKSFAVIREEERQKRPDGKEPTRAELYIITHTRKDGEPVDEIAAETIAKLREKAAEKQRAECDEDEDDTFCEVMGELRSEQLRVYGPGREPLELLEKRPSRLTLARMVYEAKRSASAEASKMSEKIDTLEQKYASIETQIGALNANMQKILEKICGSTEQVNSS